MPLGEATDAGGGGIVREGRCDGESQSGAEGQEVEDQFMRDRVHAEKRKKKVDTVVQREAIRDARVDSSLAPTLHRRRPHLGRSLRLWLQDWWPGTRWDNRHDEGSPTTGYYGSDTPREITMNNIMQHSIDTQRKAQEKEDREREEIRKQQERMINLRRHD